MSHCTYDGCREMLETMYLIMMGHTGRAYCKSCKRNMIERGDWDFEAEAEELDHTGADRLLGRWFS